MNSESIILHLVLSDGGRTARSSVASSGLAPQQVTNTQIPEAVVNQNSASNIHPMDQTGLRHRQHATVRDERIVPNISQPINLPPTQPQTLIQQPVNQQTPNQYSNPYDTNQQFQPYSLPMNFSSAHMYPSYEQLQLQYLTSPSSQPLFYPADSSAGYLRSYLLHQQLQFEHWIAQNSLLNAQYTYPLAGAADQSANMFNINLTQPFVPMPTFDTVMNQDVAPQLQLPELAAQQPPNLYPVYIYITTICVKYWNLLQCIALILLNHTLDQCQL